MIEDKDNYVLPKGPLKKLVEGLPWDAIEELANSIRVLEVGNQSIQIEVENGRELRLSASDDNYGYVELGYHGDKWYVLSFNPYITIPIPRLLWVPGITQKQ